MLNGILYYYPCNISTHLLNQSPALVEILINYYFPPDVNIHKWWRFTFGDVTLDSRREMTLNETSFLHNCNISASNRIFNAELYNYITIVWDADTLCIINSIFLFPAPKVLSWRTVTRDFLRFSYFNINQYLYCPAQRVPAHGASGLPG